MRKQHLSIKKTISILLFFTSFAALAQAPDTSTYEKKARYKISRIRDYTTQPISPADFRAAFTAIADMAAKRVPFLTPAEVRAGKADTARVIFLNDGLRSGNFIYMPGSVALDDSSMVIRDGARRYVRDAGNVIRPEWFGANPKDTLDDYIPMQKALNAVGNFGAEYQLSEGEYFVKGGGLKAKKIDPNNIGQPRRYRLTITGKGKGTTRITGAKTGGIMGKNLLEFRFETGDAPEWYDSDILIRNLTFNAGKADRCLYVQRVINVKLNECTFNNGEIECVKLGDGGDGNTFAGYVHGCYFGGSDSRGGINGGCLNFNFNYGEITNNVSDGGKYALFGGLSQAYIAGNTFEGAKISGIYSSSTGGGGNKIIGNTIRPYTGYDPNGVYQGIQHGIHLNAVSGGMASNVIVGNQIFIPDPASNDIVTNVSNTGSSLIASPHATYKVTGKTSGTIGLLVGINSTAGTVLLQVTTGTRFVVGETVTQSKTGATFVINSFVTNSGYAINLTGNAGYNTVTGNRLSGGTAVVNSESPGNIFSSNTIAGIRDGLYLSSSAQITDNFISLFAGSGLHKAVKRKGTNPVLFSNNVYPGSTLDNIPPPALSDITTTKRDALTTGQKYPGLILNNTTTNNANYFNGSEWVEFNTERVITDFNKITGNVSIASVGHSPLNGPVGGQYGNGWQVSTNKDAKHINQLVFDLTGTLHTRTKYGGVWGSWYKVWTGKEFSVIAAQVNSPATTSTVAAGPTPTKAEFDALRADYLAVKTTLDALLTKMRTSKILTP